MRYLRIEWAVAVPDDLDINDLAVRAHQLVPTEFYGLTDIIGRVYVEDEGDGEKTERPQNE